MKKGDLKLLHTTPSRSDFVISAPDLFRPTYLTHDTETVYHLLCSTSLVYFLDYFHRQTKQNIPHNISKTHSFLKVLKKIFYLVWQRK